MKRSLIDNARRNASRKVNGVASSIMSFFVSLVLIVVAAHACTSGGEEKRQDPCGVETFDGLHISEKYQCAYKRDFMNNGFGKMINLKAIIAVQIEMDRNSIKHSDDINLVDNTTKIAIDDKTYTMRVLYRTDKESKPRYSDVVIDLKTGDALSVELNPKSKEHQDGK